MGVLEPIDQSYDASCFSRYSGSHVLKLPRSNRRAVEVGCEQVPIAELQLRDQTVVPLAARRWVELTESVVAALFRHAVRERGDGLIVSGSLAVRKGCVLAWCGLLECQVALANNI